MDGSLQPGPAPRFSRTPSEVSHKAPEIGADTPAVLRELGFPDREVQQLLEGGVAFGPISARESEV